MKRLLFLITLLFMVVWGSSPVLYSQDQAWSRPQYLGDGWFPDITADPTGQLHTVWVSSRTDDTTHITYDQVLYTTSVNGACWLSANDIVARDATGGAEATRPTILADEQGYLHLTFRNPIIHYAQTSVIVAAQSARWRTTPISYGYYSYLALGNQARLHLVYTQNVSSAICPICYHLYYQSSVDGGLTWSEPVDISRLPIGAVKPQLQLDAEDNLYLLWESGEGGAQGQVTEPTTINFATSSDLGVTWSLPFQLSLPQQAARQPGLGLDGKGQLVAVWLGTGDDLFYYSTSADRGRNWTSPTPIANIWGGWSLYPARLDHTVMERDDLGHLHLVLVGRTTSLQNGLDLLHLTWDGTTWSAPETIATFTTEFPEWPEITISHGNQLHVVWFTRPRAYVWSGGYNSQVWYAARTLDSPGTTSLPWPTATPVPTLLPCLPTTSSTGITATHSPPTLPLNPIHISNEMDLRLIFLKGLIPSGLFLILAFALICWWRRYTHLFPTGEE